MSKHVNQEMLEAYAAANIDAASGLLVATHLEMCEESRSRVDQLEQHHADQLNALECNYTSDFDGMLESIMSTKPHFHLTPSRTTTTTTIAGKSFELPSTLTKFADRISEWRRYGSKVMSAQIEVEEDVRMNLLYLAEDAQVPQHTHKGIETTLILHGGFSDEDGHYHEGDLLVKDASDKHAPFTRKGEDCLCLVVLTEPMIFTQGVARIFNRFGRGMYP
ncbi:ChrR family anti-sigma-E factor [Vibrio sp. SCSIO 43136]|uniref:ChrR family anti-sigma-E factor n=1 Tax=Vibrio sp. SCSIO 43136 TaxID=2819101 RepID=UPI002075BF2B|nr:ChrR family anti-sigma-E factor [Vibrio sp. SCSIO 43136]USD65356.1 cupin domain-containing protein [Vibrio sp. SCSIO 43136]